MAYSTRPSDPSATELASGFTVGDYEAARDRGDRDAIAAAIRRRFTERYVEPVSGDPTRKHGFSIMAVACLMIEALESFRQGWETSDKRSKAAFCFFFDATDELKQFRGHAQGFYTNVRCGILHQAETTGGKIRRDGPLFDPSALIINATAFLEGLRQALEGYCDRLTVAPWEGQEWKRARDKMNALAKHCRS